MARRIRTPRFPRHWSPRRRMAATAVVVVLIAVAGLARQSGCLPAASPARGPVAGFEEVMPGEPYPVVHIVDGDTLDIRVQGEKVRLRLHGIDTPEMGQPFGPAAKEFAAELLEGKSVTVDPIDKGGYGRLVAEVYLPDGNSFNQELVRQGYAWWYERYKDDPILERLQAEARRARRGLWQQPNPIPPWEYRKR